MKKRYEWRELTDDGLMKKPESVGPYYDQENVNTYGGYASEDEAVAAYEAFKASHEWGVPSELVLVCFHCTSDA